MIDLTPVGDRLAANGSQKQNDVHAVAALRVIAAAEPKYGFDFANNTGLFLDFAYHRLLDCFIGLDETAGQLPVAAAMPRCASDQQQSMVADDGASDTNVVAFIVAFRYCHQETRC